MSEDSLAYKIPDPVSSAEAEYEAVRAALSETASGRRFLEEYARRRLSDTGVNLAAIERMQARLRGDGESFDFFLFAAADMARAIARTKQEIARMKPPPERQGQFEDAAEELDSIVRTTERAAWRILAAAEAVQEIAWTLREKEVDTSLCDQLDAQATEIYMACSFQDLTGQRTRKVIQVLGYLEERINGVIEIWGKNVAPAPPEQKAGSELLNGPSREGGLEQADVDAMMQPAEFPDERQDASIEDIGQFMAALEPLIAAHPDTGREKAGDEQADVQAAGADREEPRPELSTTMAVLLEGSDTMAESDTALLAEQTAVATAEEHTDDTRAIGESHDTSVANDATTSNAEIATAETASSAAVAEPVVSPASDSLAAKAPVAAPAVDGTDREETSLSVDRSAADEVTLSTEPEPEREPAQVPEPQPEQEEVALQGLVEPPVNQTQPSTPEPLPLTDEAEPARPQIRSEAWSILQQVHSLVGETPLFVPPARASNHIQNNTELLAPSAPVEELTDVTPAEIDLPPVQSLPEPEAAPEPPLKADTAEISTPALWWETSPEQPSAKIATPAETAEINSEAAVAPTAETQGAAIVAVGAVKPETDAATWVVDPLPSPSAVSADIPSPSEEHEPQFATTGAAASSADPVSDTEAAAWPVAPAFTELGDDDDFLFAPASATTLSVAAPADAVSHAAAATTTLEAAVFDLAPELAAVIRTSESPPAATISPLEPAPLTRPPVEPAQMPAASAQPPIQPAQVPSMQRASTAVPPKSSAKPPVRTPNDPLAPLRAMSDEEKIALFS